MSGSRPVYADLGVPMLTAKNPHQRPAGFSRPGTDYFGPEYGQSAVSLQTGHSYSHPSQYQGPHRYKWGNGGTLNTPLDPRGSVHRNIYGNLIPHNRALPASTEFGPTQHPQHGDIPMWRPGSK
jgi:hypothetical protein